MNVLRNDLQKLAALAEQAPMPEDPWRPGFHLAPAAGFLNDPNGLCRFRGEYHVFYQYAPFAPDGRGVRFWGHFKSPDLLRWERCPVMLCPDEPFDLHGAYSGSALVQEEGLYLCYTGNVKHPEGDYIRTGRESNTVLAFSPDGLRLAWKRLLMTNRDYPRGLTLHVRDPKLWEQDGMYYMVQGARTQEDIGEVLVFQSADKLHWTHINTLRTPKPLGYMWECPDLFEVDGQWVLLACPQGVDRRGPGFENRYACGYFPLSGDFREGGTLGDFVPLDYGFDFYAPQTFQDGDRRLLVGWMGMPDADSANPTVSRGWQHCLTVPRELHWERGHLTMTPARELEDLRGPCREASFSGTRTLEVSPMSDILVSWEDRLALDLAGAELRAEGGTLTLDLREEGCGRTRRTMPLGDARSLRLLADTSCLEVFVEGGTSVLSTRWYPQGPGRTLTLQGEGRAAVCGLSPMSIRPLEA